MSFACLAFSAASSTSFCFALSRDCFRRLYASSSSEGWYDSVDSFLDKV